LKIAGIVLAGGLSSRMGQDKALLQLEEQTLLTRSLQLLASLNLAQLFVSGNYRDFNCIPDRQQEMGPIGGIEACVSQLFDKFDALFIIPVDMPLLSTTECKQLLNEYQHKQQGVFSKKFTFPMILPLNLQLKEYLSEILTSPHKKDRSLFRLLETLNISTVDYSQQQFFRFQNSNTPQEWQNCLKTYNKLHITKDLK